MPGECVRWRGAHLINMAARPAMAETYVNDAQTGERENLPLVLFDRAPRADRTGLERMNLGGCGHCLSHAP